MSDPRTGVPAGYVPARLPPQGENGVVGAMLLSACVALIAVIVGIRLMMERHVRTCPNGTYFPQGTKDFRCFMHPHTTDGLLVILFSVLVELGVVLSGVTALVALRVLDRQREAGASAARV